MLYLQKDANVLVIQDIPVGYWIGALLSAIPGILLLGVQVNDLRHGGDVSVLGVVMVVYFLGAAGYFGRATIAQTIVDRNLRTVSIDRKGLFGRKFRTYRFDDVQGGAILREFSGRRRRNAYSIQLLMKEGKPIDLMTREGLGEGPIFEAVDRINEYLGMTVKTGDYVPTQLNDIPDEL